MWKRASLSLHSAGKSSSLLNHTKSTNFRISKRGLQLQNQRKKITCSTTCLRLSSLRITNSTMTIGRWNGPTKIARIRKSLIDGSRAKKSCQQHANYLGLVHQLAFSHLHRHKKKLRRLIKLSFRRVPLFLRGTFWNSLVWSRPNNLNLKSKELLMTWMTS